MALAVTEKLAHRAAGVGRDVLHGRRIGRGGGHHDGVIHGAVIFEGLHHLRYGGSLLADGDIDTDHVAALLVDNRVERDRGLSGLPVANDQLALAAADRNHGIDRFDAGLQRLFHRAAIHDARRDGFNRQVLRRRDGALAVNRLAERVDHAPDHGLSNRNRHDFAGAPHFVAFADLLVFAEQYDADLVLFEIEGDPGYVVRELNHLAGHYVLESINTGDTVPDRDH